MALLVVGLNHTTAPVAVRERLAFADQTLAEPLARWHDPAVEEVVILSTCNRVECYLQGPDAEAGARCCIDFLATSHGLPEAQFVPHLYQWHDLEAVRHLFRVASSLDSLVLAAFDTLFNKRDYAAAERFWSPHYVQHSAHIAPGRDGLFNLVKSLPPTLKYEPGTIVAEGDFVIVHGRFSGFGLPVNWIAADILRIENEMLVEHWDVIQDEATRASSKSGLPMFGDTFRA